MKTFMDDRELTRRHFDMSCILADTLLMCDNMGQMGEAKECKGEADNGWRN